MLKGDSLKDALELFKNQTVDKRKKILRPGSLKNRRNFFIRFERYIFSEQGGIFDFETVSAYIDHSQKRDDGKTAAKVSVNSYIAKLRAFNDFCVQKGFLTRNFCLDLIKYPEEETLPPPIHLDIDYRLLPKIIILGTTPGKGDRSRSIYYKTESRWMLFFMLHTGMRSGGVSTLSGLDLHFEAENPFYILTLKGGKKKSFPLPRDQQLLDELRNRVNNKKLFNVSPDTTIKHFRDGLRAIGIRESITARAINHTFRKMFVQERKRNGSSIDEIADAIGDEPETVKKYYLADDPDDLIHTVNNSRLIKHGQPLLRLLDDIVEEIRLRVTDDDRFEIPRQGFRDGNFEITIPIKKAGLEELKKNKRS